MAESGDNVRRRSACDRCHSQKLRCPRRPGVDVCDRCAKARASCVYSPFRQKSIAKERNEDTQNVPDRQERNVYHNNIQNGIHEVGSKRKRTNGPSLSNLERGFDTSAVQPDPLIVDPIGFDWASNSYPPFSDLEIDPAFGDFNFDTIHGGQPLPHLYNTSDSSGVSDTPSPASYETGSDQMPSMPFTFQPLPTGQGNMFQLESSPVVHAFDNVIPIHRFEQENSMPRYAATSPPGWDTAKKELQPAATSKCVRQLSELSISLYEHSTTLPPQFITDPLQSNDEGQRLDDNPLDSGSKQYGEFNLDETFQLTQNLLDIYPTFIDILKRRHSTLAPIASLKSGNALSNQFALDQSSILLILSCHLRLIEIYEDLFPHMEVCISQKGKAYNTPQAMQKAPFMKFGGFTPPSSSTVSMQMMYLVQLAKKLLDCSAELSKVTHGLRDLESKDEPGSGRTNVGTGSLDISVLTADNVKGRANNMAQQFGTLRDLMLQMGIFA